MSNIEKLPSGLLIVSGTPLRVSDVEIDHEPGSVEPDSAYRAAHDQVYARDTRVPDDEGECRIQWKGTSVCMDVHCACGANCHVDAEFAYYYRCPACKKTFAVGQTIRLIELSEAELAGLEVDECSVVAPSIDEADLPDEE
jgi:hypothetical protein